MTQKLFLCSLTLTPLYFLFKRRLTVHKDAASFKQTIFKEYRTVPATITRSKRLRKSTINQGITEKIIEKAMNFATWLLLINFQASLLWIQWNVQMWT